LGNRGGDPESPYRPQEFASFHGAQYMRFS
jgi:hypothetical protein